MKTLTYTVRIEPAEEGGYNVFVPALPGCHTQAETYEEAVGMSLEHWSIDESPRADSIEKESKAAPVHSRDVKISP